MTAGAFLDACGFIPVSSGTGDFVVSAAIQGYQTPASAGGISGVIYSYRAQSADKSQWEEGYGAYTVSSTTLARTTVTASSTGSKVNFSAAPNVFITALSADLNAATQLGAGIPMINGTLVTSVAAGALTIAIKTLAGTDPSPTNPVYVIFRNATAATGDYTILALTAATSYTVASTWTLGTANSTPFRLWIVGFNDAGTFRLGVINCLSGTNIYPLQAWAIASSSATTGTSAQTFYTGSAVASKPYAVLGYASYESGLATAGSWSATPTRLQLFNPGIVPLPGTVIQTQRSATGAAATGTTQIPSTNTIPQNTQGDQYFSQAITPTSAANILNPKWNCAFSCSALSFTALALFQDSIANALAVSMNTISTAGYLYMYPGDYKMLAGAAASTIFKLRAGANVAGTVQLNGSTLTAGGAGQIYGGALISFLEISEIMA